MQIPVRNAVIALVTHLLLMIGLVQFGRLHIYGVVIAYMFFAILMCILNGAAIRKHLDYHQEIKRTFVIPAVSSLIMALAVWLLYQPLHKVIGVRISTVLCLGLAVILYAFFILLLHGITEDELRAFPKGRTLVRILKKIHLL